MTKLPSAPTYFHKPITAPTIAPDDEHAASVSSESGYRRDEEQRHYESERKGHRPGNERARCNPGKSCGIQSFAQATKQDVDRTRSNAVSRPPCRVGPEKVRPEEKHTNSGCERNDGSNFID
jgi:hypothetical protein